MDILEKPAVPRTRSLEGIISHRSRQRRWSVAQKVDKAVEYWFISIVISNEGVVLIVQLQ